VCLLSETQIPSQPRSGTLTCLVLLWCRSKCMRKAGVRAQVCECVSLNRRGVHVYYFSLSLSSTNFLYHSLNRKRTNCGQSVLVNILPLTPSWSSNFVTKMHARETTTIKSSEAAVCFHGINRLGSAFLWRVWVKSDGFESIITALENRFIR